MKQFVIAIFVILQFININCDLEPLECLPQVARMQGFTFCQFINQSSKTRDVSRIHVIPSMFQGQYIDVSRVTAIMLVNCEFDHIPTAIFKNFGDIKVLRIVYSNITSLENDDFKTATELKQLEIKDSKIGRISSKTFEQSKNLEEVTIEGSEIGIFSEDAFDGPENLKTVNLKGNTYAHGTPNLITHPYM